MKIRFILFERADTPSVDWRYSGKGIDVFLYYYNIITCLHHCHLLTDIIDLTFTEPYFCRHVEYTWVL